MIDRTTRSNLRAEGIRLWGHAYLRACLHDDRSMSYYDRMECAARYYRTPDVTLYMSSGTARRYVTRDKYEFVNYVVYS